jgi:hypothetical protein
MKPDRSERYGGLSGIAFVGLFLVTLFLGSPTDFGDPAAEVASYYREDQREVQVSVALWTAGLFFFLWFLGALRNGLRAAEGAPGTLSTIAFGAGLLSAGFLGLTAAFVAAAAARPDELDPELTRVIDDLTYLVLAPGSFAVVGFLLASALVVLRSEAMPAWLGWLALIPAAAQALSVGIVFSDRGPFGGSGLFHLVGLMGLLVWVLAVSIVLLKRSGQPNTSGRSSDQVPDPTPHKLLT